MRSDFRTPLEYVMTEVREKTLSQRIALLLTTIVVTVGRFLAMLTVAAVALSTTAAGLGVWWYVTHGRTPVPSLQGIDARVYLAVYALLMVCPWWALLAVMFHRLNWLERAKPAAVPARPAAPAARHARATAG